VTAHQAVHPIDVKLSAEIQAIHRASRGTYGVPRIHAELAERGMPVGRKRVARLMRGAGLQGVSRRKAFRTTVRDAAARPAPDLVARHFTAAGPDQLWVADITYVPTWAGFLYLAVVVDAWSRRVIGWAMETHLRTELVLAALNMAVTQRRPTAVIHHSDQGCQGGFNWSSQQLEEEELRWPQGGSAALIGRCERRCVHQGAHRSLGASIDSASGTRSRAGCRAKKRPSTVVFLLPLVRAGSVKLVACRRSVERHCRSAICLSRSARRSRFVMQQAAEFARSLAS